MMVALLLYAYCLGVRSSRAIERRCVEDIAFRVLAGNHRPDHVTIARFRQRHELALADVLVDSLRLCADAGLVRLGTVALDGTKIEANASRHASRTLAEIEAEVAAILADAVPGRYRALVLVAGVLGLRWSEAIGLRVGDVDFLRRTVTVAQTISEVGGRLEVAATKTTASRRTLSVPPFLLDELASHIATHLDEPAADELLFRGPKGSPLRRSFAARVFSPAVERAGLDPALTFHGLRHVATSLMVESGEHPRVIQHRLGHSTARLSMELYAHVPDAADRDAATRLEDRFRAVEGSHGAEDRSS